MHAIKAMAGQYLNRLKARGYGEKAWMLSTTMAHLRQRGINCEYAEMATKEMFEQIFGYSA